MFRVYSRRLRIYSRKTRALSEKCSIFPYKKKSFMGLRNFYIEMNNLLKRKFSHLELRIVVISSHSNSDIEFFKWWLLHVHVYIWISVNSIYDNHTCRNMSVAWSDNVLHCLNEEWKTRHFWCQCPPAIDAFIHTWYTVTCYINT